MHCLVQQSSTRQTHEEEGLGLPAVVMGWGLVAQAREEGVWEMGTEVAVVMEKAEEGVVAIVLARLCTKDGMAVT